MRERNLERNLGDARVVMLGNYIEHYQLWKTVDVISGPSPPICCCFVITMLCSAGRYYKWNQTLKGKGSTCQQGHGGT